MAHLTTHAWNKTAKDENSSTNFSDCRTTPGPNSGELFVNDNSCQSLGRKNFFVVSPGSRSVKSGKYANGSPARSVKVINFDEKCDNCGKSDNGDESIVRWCDDCCTAVCYACILDGHAKCHTTRYVDAVRRRNREIDDEIESAKLAANQVIVKREESQSFTGEILLKIRDMQRKVIKLGKETKIIPEIMEKQLSALDDFGKLALTSNTAANRRYAMNASKILMETLWNRVTMTIDQFQRIDSVTNEIYEQIGFGRIIENLISSDEEDIEETMEFGAAGDCSA